MQAVIPLEKLRDFIGYARSRCQPELSDEAAQDLVQAYQTMRNQGVGRNTITATPRQLESMVRLSEALARMRLSSTVERHDVAEAVRLMKVSASFPRFNYSTLHIRLHHDDMGTNPFAVSAVYSKGCNCAVVTQTVQHY